MAMTRAIGKGFQGLEKTCEDSSSTVSESRRNNKQINFAFVLRALGVFLLGASAILFLVQGVENLDGAYRDWVYPLLILAACGAGILARYALADVKGGRLFFIAALSLVPVQVSQLAGWVYLTFGGDSHLNNWLIQEASVNSMPLWIMCLITLGASVPAIFMGFSILVRLHAAVLITVFVALNGFLLMPWRAGVEALCLVICCASGVIAINALRFSQARVFQSVEGIVARGVLFIPLVIMFVRSCFYISGNIEAACWSSVVAVFCIGFGHYAVKASWVREVILSLGLVAGSFSAILVLLDFGGHWEHHFLVALSLSLMFYLAGSSSRNLRGFYRHSAGVLFLVAALILQNSAGYLSVLLGLFFTALLCYLSVVKKEKPLLVWTIFVVILDLVYLSQLVFKTELLGSWLGIGLFGFAVILLSSFVERLSKIAHARAWSLYSQVKSWDD